MGRRIPRMCDVTPPRAGRDPLEPDRETLASWLRTFTDAVLDHLDRLPTTSAAGILGPEGAAIAQAASRPIPEEPFAGGAPELAALVTRAAEASLNTIGPGYLAYIPGGGLPTTAIADFVADLLNRYTGLVPAAPGPTRLESDVVRWLASEFGYGPDAAGLLTSGGSLSQLSAMVTARYKHFGDVAVPADARAYTSTQAHRSVAKALRLAGHGSDALRSVAVDGRWRMDPDALAAAVKRDRANGLRPFLVVAAAGTTNTGAIDPLPAIADVCVEHGLWLHVDGAYGGAFVLCPEGRAALHGIERADSITFDPHKGMFLPYGTGALLVRDGAALRRAHRDEADYLQDLDLEAGAGMSPAEHGPELSRPFRGLRLWLPLMLHGARAFREALSEKIALARSLHEGLARLPHVEIVDPPQLSIVAFRASRRQGESLAAWNARNEAWMDAINARGHVILSSTLLPTTDGQSFTLRACVLSFRTHADRIEALLQDAPATL
jgi:aromatic-L-amino-acid/L-tryptophan decarboxylase